MTHSNICKATHEEMHEPTSPARKPANTSAAKD
jgi:hypothetical protein